MVKTIKADILSVERAFKYFITASLIE